MGATNDELITAKKNQAPDLKNLIVSPMLIETC
jgi:hypothetical protein